MNYLKVTVCSLCLISLFSCGSKNENQAEPPQNLDQFRSFNIDMNAPQRKITDLIESVRIFKLEETEESLLGNVFNVTVHDHMIVFPNTSENTLYFFDDKGNFIRKLNKGGDGPEEYSSLWSYWFKGDTLKIYDNERPRVAFYSLQGDYLGAIKVPERANHVYEDERGYWLDMSLRFRGDSTNYELISYDHLMQNPKYFLPFNQQVGFPITTTTNSMTPYKDKMLYKQILNDTVYSIDGDELEPLAQMNFGSEFLWSDEEMRDNPQGAMNSINESGKVWIVWPKIGERFIYLTYNISFQDSFDMLIDRVAGQQVKIDKRKTQEEKFGLMFNLWKNDEMLVGVNSLDLAEILGELSEEQYSFEEGSSLDLIESSENPAMMWVKFKSLD